MKITRSLSLVAIVACVTAVAVGCGGSSETAEYHSAVITQNADSSLTISDGQNAAKFSKLVMEPQESKTTNSGTLQQGMAADSTATCTCATCKCSLGTCVCTGCVGNCPQ